MYAVVVGGGKVGLNLTRELLNKGAEVTLIEQRRDRFNAIEAELEYVAQYGDGTEPVSYTHLRAHETVLDLVCRLLLEKKKHPASPPPLRPC